MRYQTKRGRVLLALGVTIFLAVVTAACGEGQPAGQLTEEAAPPAAPVPSETPVPTPTAVPPSDLLVSSAEVSMQGYAEGCAVEERPLVTTFCVQNQGESEAGPFGVRASHLGGGVDEWQVDGLGAGEERCIEETGSTYVTINVDAEDAVAEADENNNLYTVPVPTPPRSCTPTPAPTATQVVVAAAATATPLPEGSKLTTEIFPVYFCEFTGQREREGRAVFTWYRVEVTYIHGGGIKRHPIKEEILAGPFTGTWRAGCPALDDKLLLKRNRDKPWEQVEWCGLRDCKAP